MPGVANLTLYIQGLLAERALGRPAAGVQTTPSQLECVDSVYGSLVRDGDDRMVL